MQYKLIISEGPISDQEYLLADADMIIGRDPAADITIASQEVSRRHARIFKQDDQYFIEDLGSVNGTFIGGEKIAAATPLTLGATIGIGFHVILKFQAEREAGDAGELLDQAGAADQTILEADFGTFRTEITPPKLTVIVVGEEPKTYTLTAESVSLGRADSNDIVIASPIVSRQHARLERIDGGYRIVPFPEATNPVYSEEGLLRSPSVLRHDQKLRIGGQDPGMMVTLVYDSGSEVAAVEAVQRISLGEEGEITIGRDPANNVVLPSPTVSRYHAQIERVGQRYRIRDLRSSNGTFVNDGLVEGEVWLKPADTIRIGAYRFVLGENQLAQYDESSGFRLEAVGLNKWVRKDLNILQNISLVFKPREFVVVVGQSGGGKSTLLDALAGYRPATHGKVDVNGVDLYKNFDAIRNSIGYVPQKDIIHMELTVYEALDYAARLRMPPDTSKGERHQRIMEVLEELDLTHRKDVQVKGLSGGQQKRVSIGVELLTKPSLFFLDEPTSGLDPGTETAFMHLMRRLADQGRTVVLVTHATKNVMLADKVVFLARGGYLGWFGPPDEALAYFDRFRTEQERRISPMEFDKIYAILEEESRGTPEEWAKRFQEDAAYHRYILSQLPSEGQAMATGLMQSPFREPATLPPVKRKVSGLYQFLVLSSRNIKILVRDRSSLVLMLAAAPLISLIDIFLAAAMGPDLYNYQNGDVSNVTVTLFMLTIYSLMVGALSQMREIVKEKEIYHRERLVNLKIIPYVMSKIWVAGVLAFYQAAAFTIVRWLAFDMPGGTQEFLMLYITLVLITLAGMMIGLLVSAISPNANSAPLLIILFIIPLIVLSGALAPVPNVASAFATTRWAFQSFMGITGVGSDVAADACWALPEEVRDEMDLGDKEAFDCRCMGVKLFDQESCDFPGIGKFYDPSVDAPEPEKPPDLGDPPPQPELPPPPEEPGDDADTLALTEYLEALRVYQEETDGIRDNYEAEVEAYQDQADVYEVLVQAYQEDLIDWQSNRTSAVGSAEGLIESIYDEFGWTFVDKEDAQVYWTRILTTWLAQGVIISVIILLILVIMKRKDRI